MEKICLNCDRPLPDASNYCTDCGQKTRLPRLSLKEVGHEAFQSFTNVDKGLFPLLKDLVERPGVAAREYIQGKRKKHYPPLNFFLLVSTIMILVLSVSSTQNSGETRTTPDLNKIEDVRAREKVRGIYERRDKADRLVRRYSDFIAMVAAPLMALIFWASYRKLGYNYTEHLVGCMYMVGFMNLIWALVFVPLTSISNIINANLGNVIEGVHKLLEIIYFSIFYKNFTSNNGKESALMSTIVSIVVVLVWSIMTVTLITLYITNGFFGLLG